MVGEEVVEISVAAGGHFNGSVVVAVSRMRTTTIEEDGDHEGGDLAGKTTTSHSATEILLSTSSQSGRCLRRSTSTAWPNST